MSDTPLPSIPGAEPINPTGVTVSGPPGFKATIKAYNWPLSENVSDAKYCLVRDDSAHWYVIPHDQRRAFNEWVSSIENNDINYKGIGYDHYRINGSPSDIVFPSYEVAQ